ncbi:MAG: hypothetical protein QM802_04480 [Agriterribacter sp.]
MKTVIIPFKSNLIDIKVIKTLIALYKEEPIHCVLLEIRPLPNNYNDLLTLSEYTPHNNQVVQDVNNFMKEANALSNEYFTLSKDHLYGDSPVVFRNYLDYRKANLVVYQKPQQEADNTATARLNLFRMVRRCNCELMYVSDEKGQAEVEVSAHKKFRFAEKATSQSILHQFSAVDNMLNGLQENLSSNQVIIRRLNNVSRYFLKESFLQDILVQSDSSLVLVKK